MPHYSSLLPVVENGHCIAVAPRRLAEQHARTSPITLFEIPLQLPAYDVRVFWHSRSDTDPGITAFRGLLHEALRR
ncbi:hypothetical protein EB72_16640 [Mycobacterium sp. SWH-M1]|nr:hypothetical protein EB72_16640 [Mycobacterium sp. SWH-M1]